MKKYKIGFVQGVFDMFHVGHLNILERAKENCDYLIVGVNSDKLVEEYKSKKTIIPCDERMRIIKALRCVDEVIEMHDRDKVKVCTEHNINAIFMGDDWKGSDFYNKMEVELKKYNVDIVYFPYTRGTSSTVLREKLLDR